QAWRPSNNAEAYAELLYRQLLSASRGTAVSAVAILESYVYTGIADGRIIVSADRGVSSQPETRANEEGGTVTAFWIDPSDPRIALATFATGRVLQTIDGGLSWIDISANLPNTGVHGVTADRAGNA